MSDLDKDFDEAYKYYEEHEYDKSLEIFEKLYEENYQIEEIIPPMVDLYLAKEDYDNGLKYINIILNLQEDNLEALSIKSYILTYMDRLDEALDIAEEIIDKDPNVEEGYLLKISILHLQSKEDDIKEFVEGLKENSPIVLEGIEKLTGLSPEDLITGISPEFDENNNIFEEEPLTNHMEGECNNPHHHHHDNECCGHHHTQNEEINPEQMEEILEGIYTQIDENIDGDVEKYLHKANAAAQFQKTDEAIDLLDKALEIDNENLDGLLLKAGILFNSMKFEESLDTINHVIDLYPENTDAITFKGFVHISLGDFEKAEESFKKALDIDDNDLEVYRQYSFAVASRGDLNRALGINQKALKKFEDSSDLWYDTYYFLNQLGSSSKAEEALNKALEINPEQKHYDGSYVNEELNDNSNDSKNNIPDEKTLDNYTDNEQHSNDFQLSGEEERLFKLLSEKGYYSASSTELVLSSYQEVMAENPDEENQDELFKKVVDLIEEKIKKEEI